MSVANILKTPITAPQITEQYATGGIGPELVIYNIPTLSNQFSFIFTPTVTAQYYIQLEMDYDQSFGIPGPGAFAEVTINGASVLTITGSAIFLPTNPVVKRAVRTGSFLLTLGAGVTFQFGLFFSGWNNPAGCSAILGLQGPF